MTGDGLWVFGYGSLMWRPGFAHDRRLRARLDGLARRLCVKSVHHRGTELRPGLVLGLDRGGVCDGIAYHVAPPDVPRTLAYLKAREQVNGVYREAHVQVDIHDEATGRLETVRALTYIAERAHPSYMGALPLAEQARIVLGARGLSGHNVGYVLSTLAHLNELKIRDRDLERLAVVLGPVLKRRCGNDTHASIASRCGTIVPRTLPTRTRYKPMKPAERRRFTHRHAMTF